MKLIKDRVIVEHPGEWRITYLNRLGEKIFRKALTKVEAEKIVNTLVIQGYLPEVTFKYPVIEVSVKVE